MVARDTRLQSLFELMTGHNFHQNTFAASPQKTLVQCDFDGTVTLEDASFIMLDAFANSDWRKKYDEYLAGKISVGRFNREAFAMVRADRKRLLASVEGKMTTRSGFKELVACCRRKNFRFVIVSNGLDFYITHILKSNGLTDIELHASRTHFRGDRLSVRYIGPDGTPLDSGFKEAYIEKFLRDKYRVVYIGDGTSDYSPAVKCHRVFATGALLDRFRREKLTCTPFSGFEEVTAVLEGV
jgi:2-hydroxy-3-keto-5-methylthiopentenyl-1-phosphate phosphatase